MPFVELDLRFYYILNFYGICITPAEIKIRKCTWTITQNRTFSALTLRPLHRWPDRRNVRSAAFRSRVLTSEVL